MHHPDSNTQDAVRSIAHAHLIEATEKGARAIGCTGASFILMGLGIWAAELSELDQRAVSRLLAALSVIFDPTANPRQKDRAERQRRKAVADILAALDLHMSPTEGRA